MSTTVMALVVCMFWWACAIIGLGAAAIVLGELSAIWPTLGAFFIAGIMFVVYNVWTEAFG